MVVCYKMCSCNLVGVLLSIRIAMSGMARCRVAEFDSGDFYSAAEWDWTSIALNLCIITGKGIVFMEYKKHITLEC